MKMVDFKDFKKECECFLPLLAGTPTTATENSNQQNHHPSRIITTHSKIESIQQSNQSNQSI
jgi:hypothetical protein